MRALIAIFSLASACAAAQTPLRVVASNGVRAVLEELEPELEDAIGDPVVFELSTSRTLAERLMRGEAFDVAILTPGLIDELISAGRIDSASRLSFARVGIGVGAPRGRATRSVATPEDLRAALLAAGSVAYGASGQSRRANEASFEALGIADQMRSKTRLTGPGEAPGLVAAGEVDLVLTLISELLRAPGVEYLGPLPPPLQAYITFAAGVSTSSANHQAAAAFIASLSSSAFRAGLERYGLEAVEP